MKAEIEQSVDSEEIRDQTGLPRDILKNLKMGYVVPFLCGGLNQVPAGIRYQAAVRAKLGMVTSHRDYYELAPNGRVFSGDNLKKKNIQ